MERQKTQTQDQKVQFFQSQSSFASESLYQGSRCDDFTQEIILNTDSIFHSLHKYFINNPLQKNINLDYLSTVSNRAKIISKQNIPQHLQYLKKIGGNQKSIDSIINCSQRLNQLVIDFQNYHNHEQTYQQLCRKYTQQSYDYPSSRSTPFKKKQFIQEQQIYFRPQVIQIVAKNGPQLKGSANYVNSGESNPPINKQQVNKKDKEIQKLYQEIAKLNKREKQMKKAMENNRINQQQQTNQRINQIILLKLAQNNSNNQMTPILKLLAETQENLKHQSAKNKQLLEQINGLENTISQLRMKMRALQNVVDTQRNRLSDSQVSQKTIYTQLDQGNVDTRKMKKNIRNLINENIFIRKQLQRQRDLNYSLKYEMSEDLSIKVEALQSQLQRYKKQHIKILQNYDRIRVQNIKIKSAVQFNNKKLSNLQTQNDILKKVIPIPQFLNYQSNNQPIIQKINKPSISSYQLDLIEGYPYYELLNKQFKIRYRRSCIKQKQLLYKSNGLQIGIISHFIAPSSIQILLHLFNYSDLDFSNLRLKIINPNDNKFKIDKQYIEIIRVGQQIKVTLEFIIINYPIGPSILVCSYINQEKSQELRVLLPAHICKMITYQPRSNDQIIRKRNQIKPFTVERKIVKDLGMLKGYFLNEKIQLNENCLKLCALHEHTGTLTFIDLKLKGYELEILYESVKGNQKITQYYVKSLQYLLSK